MAGTKLQFYKHGTDKQKRADITMDLRRPNRNGDWTVEQKIYLKGFIKDMEVRFKAFIGALEEVAK